MDNVLFCRVFCYVLSLYYKWIKFYPKNIDFGDTYSRRSVLCHLVTPPRPLFADRGSVVFLSVAAWFLIAVVIQGDLIAEYYAWLMSGLISTAIVSGLYGYSVERCIRYQGFITSDVMVDYYKKTVDAPYSREDTLFLIFYKQAFESFNPPTDKK